MGQIRNSQIRDNDLTGRSINRNFRFFDEQELPINKGEVRFWQGKWWRTLQDITTAETGGSIPKEGDLTYSPDLQSAYWQEVPNYGMKKYVFESFSLYYSGSITVARLIREALSPLASRMVTNWAVYGANCLFDVTSGSQKWSGLQFASENDYVTWHNNQTFPGQINVEVYGIIDLSRGQYHKVYGRNEGLSIIKGSNPLSNNRSNYHKGCCLLSSNWDNKEDFAVDVLERLTGTTPSSPSDATRCIHFPGNPDMYKMYQTLNTPNTIHFYGGTSSDKRAYNPSTQGVSNITNGDEFTPIPGANGFYKITISSAMWQFAGVQNVTDNEYLQGQSLVKIYGFQRSDGHVIAIVKPVGQDAFRLSWKEPITGKTLLGGFYNKDDKMRLEDITAFSSNPDGYGTSFHINKGAITARQKSSSAYRVADGRLRNIAMFVADGDGYMVPVSHEIEWQTKRNGAKAYTLLNNSHFYS